VIAILHYVLFKGTVSALLFMPHYFSLWSWSCRIWYSITVTDILSLSPGEGKWWGGARRKGSARKGSNQSYTVWNPWHLLCHYALCISMEERPG